jgi:hypothetical protein
VLSPGAPGAWDDSMVGLPFVTSVDSLVMYYGGSDGASFQTGYAGTVSSLVPTLARSHAAAWRGSGVEISWTLSQAGTNMRFSILRGEVPPDEPANTRYLELDAGAIVRNERFFVFIDSAVEPGKSYRYAVQLVTDAGRRPLFETEVVSVPSLRAAIERVIPNPFNPQTTIEYTVAGTGRVRLGVYDAAGRLVRLLVDAPREAGRYAESWAGFDERGAAAASGVYFIRLEADGRVEVRKAVLAK